MFLSIDLGFMKFGENDCIEYVHTLLTMCMQEPPAGNYKNYNSRKTDY